ncbi:hypothetical protein QR680_004816 [Steinernema hermaphroditum]|uniref:Uncharacterized protein n=1 Tax=Steinernema hermaphroditum TaxID=289476 RepID=A0AA39HPX7_9BILA|nr:hypothetical protein QR680_004816 [Steinernema hermaphroditum]
MRQQGFIPHSTDRQLAEMVGLRLLTAAALLLGFSAACTVSDYVDCAKKSAFGFAPPNAETIHIFCRSYRKTVAECLAQRTKTELANFGSASSRGELLMNCTKSEHFKGDPVAAELALSNSRFYMLACVYNDIADVHEPKCFDFLTRNCSGATPPNECLYSDCPPKRRADASAALYKMLATNETITPKAASTIRFRSSVVAVLFSAALLL